MLRTIIATFLLFIASLSASAKSPFCYGPSTIKPIDPDTPGLSIQRVIFDDQRAVVTVIAVRSTGEQTNGLPRSPEVIVLHGTGSSFAEAVEVSGGTHHGTLRVNRQGDSIRVDLTLGTTSAGAVLSRQP